MMIEEGRPWISENLRVAPEHVKAVNEDLRRRGIPNVGFDESGRAVAHSRKGRNELLKYMGKRDNDAGYGDYNGR
jgi:hypothetical protein